MAESLHDHYRRLLGLQIPWEVSDVKLDLAQQRVQIQAQLDRRLSAGQLPGVREIRSALRSGSGAQMAPSGYHAV
jgi:hypothetical protein